MQEILYSRDDVIFRQGDNEPKGDNYVITSETMEDLEYFATEADADGSFTMNFPEIGDAANMKLVDQETIINDILANIRPFI